MGYHWVIMVALWWNVMGYDGIMGFIMGYNGTIMGYDGALWDVMAFIMGYDGISLGYYGI